MRVDGAGVAGDGSHFSLSSALRKEVVIGIRSDVV